MKQISTNWGFSHNLNQISWITTTLWPFQQNFHDLEPKFVAARKWDFQALHLRDDWTINPGDESTVGKNRRRKMVRWCDKGVKSNHWWIMNQWLGFSDLFRSFRMLTYDAGEDEVSGALVHPSYVRSFSFLLGLGSSRWSGSKNETSFPSRMTFFCRQKTQLGSAHLLYWGMIEYNIVYIHINYVTSFRAFCSHHFHLKQRQGRCFV